MHTHSASWNLNTRVSKLCSTDALRTAIIDVRSRNQKLSSPIVNETFLAPPICHSAVWRLDASYKMQLPSSFPSTNLDKPRSFTEACPSGRAAISTTRSSRPRPIGKWIISFLIQSLSAAHPHAVIWLPDRRQGLGHRCAHPLCCIRQCCDLVPAGAL